MQTQRINITLPKKILKELDARVKKGNRSSFIAKALSEKLENKNTKKISLAKSLEINKEFYKKEYEIWKPLETEGWPE